MFIQWQRAIRQKPVVKQAAGLLMYRWIDVIPEVFIVHPGGPSWAKQDLGAWSIPKGEIDDPTEPPIKAAQREFTEETSFAIDLPLFSLGNITQRSGKVVHAWAFYGDRDPAKMKCNEITIDYPRGSGKMITIPEVDRGQYFTPEIAKMKLNPAQAPLVDRLVSCLTTGLSFAKL